FRSKDYFTIYDFYQTAHKKFNDPEWDGALVAPEPATPLDEPEPCNNCGQYPCICDNEHDYCEDCGNSPCTCRAPRPKMIRVRLSDHKVRELDSMVKTSFWSPDGKPISGEEFMRRLFGDLPDFFDFVAELRERWSMPDTRKKVLEELKEKGYAREQLEELKRKVHGENSDLFDVLSYVAYHKKVVPRAERANRAKLYLDSYNKKQQQFINFVLSQYVKDGVSELDDDKLPE